MCCNWMSEWVSVSVFDVDVCELFVMFSENEMTFWSEQKRGKKQQQQQQKDRFSTNRMRQW